MVICYPFTTLPPDLLRNTRRLFYTTNFDTYFMAFRLDGKPHYYTRETKPKYMTESSREDFELFITTYMISPSASLKLLTELQGNHHEIY